MKRTSNTDRHLAALLAHFNATQLGEGDVNAGANLLAAMAVTLSNLARPGSGVMMTGGRLMPVGCNLLVSGPLVTDLVVDEVITPVGRCQSRLLHQLMRLRKKDAAEVARNLPRRWALSDGPEPSSGEHALFRLMTCKPDMPPLVGTYEDEWASVVADDPSERLEDLVKNPRAFIAATTPGQLEQQLPGAHRGQTLVALGLSRSGDAAKFGDLCPALMDGLVPGGPLGETIRGRLLVTARGRILHEAATASGDKTAWLARLVWLVEGRAGPELPTFPPHDGSIIQLSDMAARFEWAVQKLFGNRLNAHKPKPVIVDADISELHSSWMEFLHDIESSLPGITGTARTLLTSLVFGLHLLADAFEVSKDSKYQPEGVEALARFLIGRMANYRAEMLFSADAAWRLGIKRKIVAKLADGRLDTRTIYRHLGMIAALCEDLLFELDREGVVMRHGRKWERVEGASLPDSSTGYLPFEV